MMKDLLSLIGTIVVLGMCVSGCGGDLNPPSMTSPEMSGVKMQDSLTFNGAFRRVGNILPGEETLPADEEVVRFIWDIELKVTGYTINGTYVSQLEMKDGSRVTLTSLLELEDGSLVNAEVVNFTGVLESETRAVLHSVKQGRPSDVPDSIDMDGETLCSDDPVYVFRGGVIELSDDGKSFTAKDERYGFPETYIRQ